MHNRLTLNGVTVEYPSELVATVHGSTVTIAAGAAATLPPQSAAAPIPPAQSAAPAESLTHITKRGKLLTGTVRTDLSLREARALDPLAFRKNGGWFIRSSSSPRADPAEPAEPVVTDAPVAGPAKRGRPPKRKHVELPPNWKTIVLDTLREQGGTAFSRMLSMRVFRGVGQVTPDRSYRLRLALRGMVDRGELRAVGGSASDQAGQGMYGLPVEQAAHSVQPETNLSRH